MESASIALEPGLLEKANKLNGQYHRQIDERCEQVDFQSDTTLRFFINDEAVSYDMHWHPSMELIMPLKHGYTVIAGQKTYELSCGDILLIPPGELHQLIAPPKGLRLIYIFDMEAVSGIRGFSYLTAFLSQPVLITPTSCPSIYEQEASLVLALCREYFNGGNLRELNCYAQLLNFFANYGEFRMLQDDSNSLSGRQTEQQFHLYDKLNSVFDYMDQHYSDPISLDTIASVAGFSKFHFSRLFKQCSGYNFYDYLCLLRIRAAENLLMNPEFSITDVALRSGFSSLSTFNRTFKKKKGCTPSEYRSLCSPKGYEE